MLAHVIFVFLAAVTVAMSQDENIYNEFIDGGFPSTENFYHQDSNSYKALFSRNESMIEARNGQPTVEPMIEQRTYWDSSNCEQKRENGKLISGTQNTKWLFTDAHSCFNSDYIVVQERSHPLDRIARLLPYRNTMVIDCTSAVDEFRLTASTEFLRVFARFGQAKRNAPAILIRAEHIRPNEVVNIMGNEIPVLNDTSNENYIGVFNQWVNIQNQSSFSRESGIFSMFTKEYKEFFIQYSSLQPFTKNVVFQVLNLGAVPASQTITTADRNLSSNFQRYDYCGTSKQRRCDGGIFIGNPPGVYIYKANDEFNSRYAQLMSYLFNDIAYGVAGQNYNKEYSRHYRSMTNQFSEYASGFNQAGRFTQMCFGSWVKCLPNTLRNGYTIDNEVSHELGHSYGLPDSSGNNLFDYKVLSYALNADTSISSPYFDNLISKKSSMNGGVGDGTDRFFTRQSDYDMATIEKIQKAGRPIDSRISYSPHNAAPGTVKTSNILLVIGNDVWGYRINADIPSMIANNTKTFNAQHDYIELTGYDSNNQVMNTLRYMVNGSQNPIAVLPKNFFQEDGGYVLMKRPQKSLEKKFFVRDDALQLPPPLNGNGLENVKKLAVFEATGASIAQHLSNLEHLLKNHFQVIFYVNQKYTSDTITIPAIKQFNLDLGMLYIYNLDKSSVQVKFPTESKTLTPNKGLWASPGNEWIKSASNPNLSPTKTLNQDELNAIVANPMAFNAYYDAGHKTVKVNSSRHVSALTIYPLDPKYNGRVLHIKCDPKYDITIIFYGSGWRTFSKGSEAFYVFNSDWTSGIFTFKNTNSHKRDIYAVPGSDMEAVSTDTSFLAQLYEYKSVSVDVTGRSPFNKYSFQLPDLASSSAGVFIVKKQTSTAQPVAIGTFKPDQFTLIAAGTYTLAATTPWEIITSDGDITNNKLKLVQRTNTSIALYSEETQRLFSPADSPSVYVVKTNAELWACGDCTKYALYDLLDEYDVVRFEYANYQHAPYLCLQQPDGYYKYNGKIVQVSVQSVHPVDLKFGVKTMRMTTNSNLQLVMGGGWSLVNYKS